MQKCHSILLAVFITILFPFASHAKSVQCPNALSTVTPVGWTLIKKPMVTDFTLYEGKLGDMEASLAPEVETIGKEMRQTWVLNKDHTFWLACRYGESTIGRELPKEIKVCFVKIILDKRHNPQHKGRIVCQ